MKIYIAGPLEGYSEHAVRRNKSRLSLVCRRVLLHGHIPVCPTLASMDWSLDPRFPVSQEWWVLNYNSKFMEECQMLCVVREQVGFSSPRTRKELELWASLGRRAPIPADTIAEVLSSGVWDS